MIAQGNAISHGARAIEYSIDKDKARLANQIVILNRPISKIASMLFHYTLTAKVASLTCTLWLTV